MPNQWYTSRMAIKKKSKKKKPASKKSASKKPPAKKKLAKRKIQPKKKASSKKSAAGKQAAAPKKRVRGKSQSVYNVSPTQEGLEPRSGGQSGDLQGLSSRQSADSESVDELLEEGNAFEADAVKGVEDADDSDEQEVHTHEVPEDDVPGEYLDEE